MRLRSPTLLLLAALVVVLALVLRGMGLGGAMGANVALAAQRTGSPAVGIPAAELEGPAAELEAVQVSLESSPPSAAPSRSSAAPTIAPESKTHSVPSARLELQVVAPETGVPLAGVRVVVFREKRQDDRAVPDLPSGGNHGSIHSSALTDAQGFVYLHVPANEGLRLSLVDQAGVGTHAAYPLTALEPEQVRRLQLPLARGGDRYFLSVLSSAAREPLAEASASFATRRTQAPNPAADFGQAKASPDGLLVIRLSAERTDWLWVRSPGYAPQRVRIGPGHDSAQDAREILLTRSASLGLQLLDADGTPVAGVSIEISTPASSLSPTADDARGCVAARWAARTNGQGWARFEGLVPDTPLAIVVQPAGELTWPSPSAQVLSPDERRELALQRVPGVRLEGRLIAKGELQVAGLKLWLLRADEPKDCLLRPAMGARTYSQTVTDAAGRFRFLDVPAGEWWLGPAPTEAGASDTAMPAPRAAWIRVPEHRKRLKLDLEVHSALWLTGRVLTAKGFFAGRQRLWAKPVLGGDGLRAWTDSEGSFRLGPVTAGTYELAVDAAFAHAGSSPCVLEAGADSIEIRLRAGASIVGLAFDPEGGQLEPLSVLVTRSDGRVQQAGSLDIEGLPDGTHGLFVRSACGRVGMLRGLVARAGHRPTEVLVELEQAAELRVHAGGQYRLWMNGVCVGEGEATEGAPLVLFAPQGSARLERIGQLSRSSLQLVAGQVLELGR